MRILIKYEKKAVKAKLENNKENAFLSKKLATIIRDVEIDFNFDELIQNPDFEKLTNTLQ